ncbi:MAG: 16S rRNA (guanine(966)-N(2))-methyltransferase RsmD [Cyanobacteriota bacterium]|nr:16S rRNA (guanine(966)-N(2))-methyltransferase RsmD [Cyanobacteriota bacterium]
MALRIYGNRLLKTLPGGQTRPTPARVREALFNIWQGKISGCRWLDLCAGSGAMGAEALCRGAIRAVGIDRAAKACGIVRQNWQQVAGERQTFQVLRGDVVRQLQGLSGREQFDRIYFDPPYDSNLYPLVLEVISRSILTAKQTNSLPLLAPDGELAIEHRPECWEVESTPGLVLCRQKTYGNTALRFYVLS